MGITTDRNDPKLKEGQKNETGQHEIYLVLSEEERAKGFVRPYHDSYIHVGKKLEIKGTIVSLESELENMSDWAKGYYTKENGYGGFLKYSKSDNSAVVGEFMKQEALDAFQDGKDYISGCGYLTKMNQALSETYARDPKFYGATFCCNCNKHLPVGEFVWDGTDETVGS